MKALVLILALVLASAARAEWRDVREGLTEFEVLQVIGVPLIINKSRSGLQTSWTYDRGGYVLFEHGRVRYWRPSEREAAPPTVVKVAKGGGRKTG